MQTSRRVETIEQAIGQGVGGITWPEVALSGDELVVLVGEWVVLAVWAHEAESVVHGACDAKGAIRDALQGARD